jgi:DNA-binding SARP family transcriptional activator
MYHHKQSIPREILMDVFWPDTGPGKARNNLNVAMHHIRKSLCTATDLPVIQFQNGMYGIAPHVQIWLDAEEFEYLVDAGKRLESRNQLREAISNYEAAISLFQGNFLEENSYEGWTALPREHLRLAHLDALDRLSQIYYSQENYAMCIALCQRILTQDRCREDSHCMLMRCYNHMGQDHLALRQYQACLNALRSELDVTPAPATTQLFDQIRQHQRT